MSSPLSRKSSKAWALESDFSERCLPVVTDEVASDSPLAPAGLALGPEATAGGVSAAGSQDVRRDENDMTLKRLFSGCYGFCYYIVLGDRVGGKKRNSALRGRPRIDNPDGHRRGCGSRQKSTHTASTRGEKKRRHDVASMTWGV